MSSSIASNSPSPPSSDWSPPPQASKRLKNVSISRGRNQTSPSPPLDSGVSLFWNASLLYHTGQSSPKIKPHHLRSAVSMSDMNRPISPAAKLLTKSPSNDSGTGTLSSAATIISSNGEEKMSPLRKRHLSCGSSTASSSSTGSLKKGKLSSSMRLLKAMSKRPSLAAFMEKTQSLGRNSKTKSAPLGESSMDETGSTLNSADSSTTPATVPSSSSGFSSTAKVFRDSFKAARNLLPSSSRVTTTNQAASLKREVSSSSSSLHSDANGSASTINYSAPNTPKLTDKKSSISRESVKLGSVGELASSGASSTSADAKGAKVTPTFTTATAIVTTSKGSSKMGSLDVTKDSGASKSIPNKLTKTKDIKEKNAEKATSKKVSLVKSLSRMRIGGRSKEKKEKDLSEESKSVSESRKPPLQEIVELENEPRVRTPKSVRKRVTTTTSYPERDREYNEMEVSEDAVEIARQEQLSRESETNKSETKVNEPKSQTLSQTSSQIQTPQPSIISKEEGKKSKSKNKIKDKGSKTTTGSSSPPTGPVMGDDKNDSSPQGYPPLPPSVPIASLKKGKAKGGKGRKSSVEPEETKSEAQVLETKLDLEDQISQERETTATTATRRADEEPDSARSSNYLHGDQAAASSTTRDYADATKGKDNEDLKKHPETNADGDGEDVVVVQEYHHHHNVTTGPFDKELRLGPTASSAEGAEEQADDDSYCTESFRQLKPFNFDLEPQEGKRERLYKVLVVGELGAGKTSIIKRYVHQFFSQHYRATIGVDFALKVLRWGDPDTIVRLQLWDIAGQERFGSMTRVYYKEAVGAFVVFDVTRGATLEAVPKWKSDLDSKVALPDGRPIPTVLLANKSDQPKEGIAANREKMNDFCQQHGFAAWFETSAKDNINIDESANFLVSKILEMDRWSQEPLATDPDKVDLSANGKAKANAASNCAC